MTSEISVESVCQFISQHGGKVKNSILVSNFKKTLNNPETRDAARQKFKECVNTVAVVKTENGDKYVQLKKKYRNPSMSSSMSSVNSETTDQTSSQTFADQTSLVTSFPMEKQPEDQHDSSFKPDGEMPYADGATARDSPGPDEKYTNFPATQAAPAPMEIYDNVPEDHQEVPSSKTEKKGSSKPPFDRPPSSAAPGDQSEPSIQTKSGSLDKKRHTERLATSADGDVQPVKDGPPKKLSVIRKSNEDLETKQDGDANQQRVSASIPRNDSAEFAVPGAPRRKKKDKKENVPPSPSLEQRFSTSIDRAKAGLQSAANEQGRLSRNRPVSVLQTSYVGSVERARLNFQGSRQKGSEDTTSLALSVDSGRGEGDEEQERTAAPICLDPNEKMWIKVTARGDLVEMRKLLDGDPSLAGKRDFVMGYTALHWAAKKGNRDMVNMLLDQPKIDVNARSNGGYTPLHLAAMHGKEHVIGQLLDYDADPMIRDYSGRQPVHYLKSVSLPLQKRLFGNDGPMKDFAAGLRPRIGSLVRNPARLSTAISGGFGSLGPLVTRSAEEVTKVAHRDASPSPKQAGPYAKDPSRKMTKKKSKKRKDERPSISIVSFDDGESGYTGSLSSKSSSLTNIPHSNSSPDINRSAPSTPNTSQGRNSRNVRSKSHVEY